MDLIDFYKNKRVFITGHTGFKGSWLCKILIKSGAIVTGYALEPPTDPSLFNIAGISEGLNSIIGDIRDFEFLNKIFNNSEPEIVIHLAAQPIVKASYQLPRYTYETNVMGTVNILECIRKSDTTKSFINVTTDKVYENKEWLWGYREDDKLNGFDPYSNSKSCSDLVTQCYGNSFFTEGRVAISTVRAGNVIGGGDFAPNRILPDCVRSAISNQDIIIRNPYSVRPYQHVLESLFAYLLIAEKQYSNPDFAGNYNVGPDDQDCYQTSKLVDIFINKWGGGISWINKHDGGPHEANLLKLDCSKLKSIFGWKPTWNLEKSIEKTVEWTKVWIKGEDIGEIMNKQIYGFLNK